MRTAKGKKAGGFFAAGLFVALAASAQIDRPSVAGWTGTAYHEGGWFSYQLAVPYSADARYPGGAAKFDKVGEFVLSPLYAAPIRKVLLKSACSSASPTRVVKLAPFVGGAETNAPKSLSVSTEVVPQVFDFAAEENVAAFRLFLDGSASTGVWGVSDIFVFYGEKTPDEDAVFREFAGQLPKPENLRAETVATNAMTVAADAVADATGYRFEVVRLSGTPRTEWREDFVSAPDLSASGWSMSASANAKLESYSSNGYYDSSAGDTTALKIDRKSTSTSAGDVEVEVETPVCEAAVRECSFFCKVGSAGRSDVFRVLGRADLDSGEWTELAAVAPADTRGTNVTVVVDAALGIVQVKFAFSASAASFTTAAWDSLSVVYGGDETRSAIVDGTAVLAEPRLALTGLDTARYSFRAQAVGGPGVRDSSWTAERTVDLSWADMSVLAPENVAVEVSGDRLKASWDAVASAERYRVTVTSEAEAVSVHSATTSAEVRVSALGGYVVTVTAFSPGGLSCATSGECFVEVSLGSLGAVEAEATDVSEITATWRAVPLAEGYLAKVFRVSGASRALVEAKGVTGCKAVFSGLDTAGTYVVEVSPQPSDGASLAAESGETDLSAVRFRKTGVAELGAGGWCDDFTSLTNIAKKTELRRTGLDFWQLYKGSEEASELMAATGGSKVAGLYACSDEEKTASSYSLGTLANESSGCVFGIALVNAGDLAVEKGVSLSFDMLQCVYRLSTSGYVFEWKVAAGETSILSEGGWTEEQIGDTAPYEETDAHPDGEYRQTVSVALAADRRILPGEVLLLRWTHPKVKNGPIMAIDNVRLSFTRVQQALRITVR